MKKEEAFEEALYKLCARFPSTCKNITTRSNLNFNDERPLVNFLEILVDECKSSVLSSYYAERVNAIHRHENGVDAGVGMANANLELRCRALIRALDKLN